MGPSTRRVFVAVWHNKQWLSWGKSELSGSHSPLHYIFPVKDLADAQGLWIKEEGEHLFGPAGDGDDRWDCLLPSFVQTDEKGTVLLRRKNGEINLTVFNRAIYQFWYFDCNGKLIPKKGERPLVTIALPLGCATFMGVLLDQPQEQTERTLNKLNVFFMGQLGVRFSKAMAVGLPSGLSSVKTLHLQGKAGTYLIANTPEARLGEGYFGQVFKGLELRNENVFAVKILNQDPKAHWMKDVIKREKRNMEIMQLVKHKHIIRFQDICARGHVLVMEYIQFGSAEELYQDLKWPSFNLFNLSKQICLALDYVHMKFDMAHRDVQPANILIRRITPLQVVLADFGSASLKSDPYEWGHMYYRAPETYAGREAHCMADVWSLGATILNLAIHPRFEFHVYEDHSKYSHNVLRRFKETEADIAPSLRHLLQGMLVRDPNIRMDASSCYQFAKMLAVYPF